MTPAMKADRVKLLVMTGLGTGFAPAAPGTWGSLLAATVWLTLALAGAPASPPGWIRSWLG